LKALIEEDIIVKLDSQNGIEIGNLPVGVGLERLRWNGFAIVDLADLSEIWVRLKNNVFELHCIQVVGSVLVSMTYADRYKLILNDGIIRLKTAEEIEQERIDKLIRIAKAKLAQKIGSLSFEKLIDLNLSVLAFICSLIIYARQQPQYLSDFYDQIIPDIIDIFPLNRWESKLKAFGIDLKQFIEDYYDEIDAIN